MAFGDLVSSFGSAGAIQTDSGFSGILSTSGGKFLVSGVTSAEGNTVRRYTSSGAPDTTFGNNGVVTHLPDGEQLLAVDSASGKIYVLATAANAAIESLTRLTSSGAVDTTFGTQGTASVAYDQISNPCMTVQSDGKILIGGSVYASDTRNTTTVIDRFNTTGARDSSFGTGGRVDLTLATPVTDFPQGNDQLAGIEEVAGGKILLAGSAADEDQYANAADSQFVVVRLTSAGAIDTSYGTSGFARSVFDDNLYFFGGARSAFEPDGSAVLISTVYPIDGLERTVIDKFSPSGARVYDVISDEEHLGAPVQATVLPDGRIGVLGIRGTYTESFWELATIDPATGDMSNVIQTLDSGVGIAAASDGNILVAAPSEIDKLDAGVLGASKPDDFVGGTINSIAYGTDGSIHLAYYDTIANDLKYAYCSPEGFWSPTVVVDATPYAGQYVSLAVRSDNLPVIAYFEGNTSSLRYASTTNRTSWTTQTIVSKGSVGLYPSLVLTADDVPAISYYDKTHGDLRFTMNRGGSTWGFEPIDTTDDAGRFNSLQIDIYAGQFSVAYVDSTTGQIKYAMHQKGGHWATQLVATQHGSDLHLRGENITYYGTDHHDLRRADFFRSSWHDKAVLTAGFIGQYSYFAYPSRRGEEYSPYFITYDQSHDRLMVTGDPNTNGSDVTVPIVDGGGAFLSVAELYTTNYVFAYYDTALGGLKVRLGPDYGEG